jgi:hypothetical protein
MINLQHLSVKQLRRVVAIKERMERLEAKLASVTGDEASDASAAPVGRRRRRKMSAAAKARIGAAQRKRWAKVKGRATAAKTGVKRKRRVSAATKARLAAVAKARWARVKAAGKSTL